MNINDKVSRIERHIDAMNATDTRATLLWHCSRSVNLIRSVRLHLSPERFRHLQESHWSSFQLAQSVIQGRIDAKVSANLARMESQRKARAARKDKHAACRACGGSGIVRESHGAGGAPEALVCECQQ